MQYDMEYGIHRSFLLILCVLVSAGSAGCLATVFGPAPLHTPAVTITPVQTAAATTSISSLALGASDLPSDYILRDRSRIAYDETGQVDRELGWRQGYQVSYYRMDRRHDDMTDIDQEIGIYSQDTINAVFRLKLDERVPATYNVSGYQVPFPIIGDQSVAWKVNSIRPQGNITSYSVIFTKDEVFEQITMKGTTTDYEALKTLAQTAAERIS